jgi:hypothetical protein
MSKKLIDLINKSNIITVFGNIGSGKSLLMSKLFRSSKLLGKKEHFSSELIKSENIFFDNLDYQTHSAIQKFYACLQTALHNHQRFLLAINERNDL